MTAGEGTDYDVAVVGGGPAGCSTAVFAARYGLETVVFDRGRSSLRRCGYLENFLGFPAGIDVETFYGLIHDHVEEAGAELRPDLVERVERIERVGDDGEGNDGAGGFRLEPQEGEPTSADRVVAATRYGAGYLRPLDEGSMFVPDDHGEEGEERFDRDCPADDGTTPIDGLYVATPAGDAGAQAVVAAGRGARVARTVIADARRDRGYPEALSEHWDWVRRESELTAEWTDRDRWREHFDDRLPDDSDASDERLRELREREIDRRLDAYLPDEEIDRRATRGHRRLLEHVDDDAILEAAHEIEARGSVDGAS
ncbi:NAD(P)/FAD-dependent oxidoreductase [Saliphagus sp. LR7]|uniref:NAD(P)/FAD-dependent oxidoreductase n=1 Tax=Saliphagus sp. LR7 TaxID=2282654 RepID=UPI000DF755F1|nr:FAD-dependent oxidoreductase [Saliphagus sp. LR7]